jgi:drug/metabolite transporter (DMT)-like permease
VATHTYANPLVAVVLGWLLASEPLTMRVVFALIAVLGAIVLICRGEHAVVPTNSKLMRAELSGGPKALALQPSRSVVGD